MATSTGYHVIVGGLGALGRPLQKTLLENGKKIRVLDILPPSNASNRLVHPSVEYAKIGAKPSDSDLSILRTALKDAETVYHVATGDVLTGTAADMDNVNVKGVELVLKACQEVGVPKMIHASSMGATNQLLEHDNEDESTPLPPWDTYRIAYDISKRQGEELVVKATTPNFQTGILRLGTILAGSSDYVSRSLLERPGTIISTRGEPLDFISSVDICRAMLRANDKLDASGNAIAGKPLFTTRCKTNKPTSVTEIAELYAQELDWRLIMAPDWLINGVRHGATAWNAVKTTLVKPRPENTAAFPFHLQLEAGKKLFTFDNDLARKLLDWEPEETWKDAVRRGAVEIREKT